MAEEYNKERFSYLSKLIAYLFACPEQQGLTIAFSTSV